MTDFNNWERQQGGLYLAVSPFDKANSEHRDAAANVMRSTIQKVAQTHGASLSEKGLRSNMRALYEGDIKIAFFLAKWELCDPKPIILGASLNWNTVGINSDGRPARGIYTEDLCILTDRMRQLIRQRPDDKQFPEESLAECFERVNLQNMLAQEGAHYRFGEVDPHNTAMLRALTNSGAMIGMSDSAVLEFGSLPNDLMDSFPMNVKIIGLRKDGKRDDNNFVVRWHEGNSDMRFIATRGRATAIGQPRADIRPWHNGRLPEQELLECIVASALLAIKREAENRNWGNPLTQNTLSPNIPLLGDRPEIYAALYDACGHELALNPADRNKTFDQPLPEAHVHILNDQRMIDAFMDVGAVPRLFGNKPMVPGVNVLRNGVFLSP